MIENITFLANTAQPTTFEFICVRAVSGRFSAIFVVLYRPGSTAVQQLFLMNCLLSLIMSLRIRMLYT